jgi:hypothetical protein
LIKKRGNPDILGETREMIVTLRTRVRAQMLLDMICDQPLANQCEIVDFGWLEHWYGQRELTDMETVVLTRKLGLVLKYLLERTALGEPVPRVKFSLEEREDELGEGPFGSLSICAPMVKSLIRYVTQNREVMYFDPARIVQYGAHDYRTPDEATAILMEASKVARDQYLRVHPEATLRLTKKNIEKINDPRLKIVAKYALECMKGLDGITARQADEEIIGLWIGSLCQNEVTVNRIVQAITLTPESIGAN